MKELLFVKGAVQHIKMSMTLDFSKSKDFPAYIFSVWAKDSESEEEVTREHLLHCLNVVTQWVARQNGFARQTIQRSQLVWRYCNDGTGQVSQNVCVVASCSDFMHEDDLDNLSTSKELTNSDRVSVDERGYIRKHGTISLHRFTQEKMIVSALNPETHARILYSVSFQQEDGNSTGDNVFDSLYWHEDRGLFSDHAGVGEITERQSLDCATVQDAFATSARMITEETAREEELCAGNADTGLARSIPGGFIAYGDVRVGIIGRDGVDRWNMQLRRAFQDAPPALVPLPATQMAVIVDSDNKLCAIVRVCELSGGGQYSVIKYLAQEYVPEIGRDIRLATPSYYRRNEGLQRGIRDRNDGTRWMDCSPMARSLAPGSPWASNARAGVSLGLGDEAWVYCASVCPSDIKERQAQRAFFHKSYGYDAGFKIPDANAFALQLGVSFALINGPSEHVTREGTSLLQYNLASRGTIRDIVTVHHGPVLYQNQSGTVHNPQELKEKNARVWDLRSIH